MPFPPVAHLGFDFSAEHTLNFAGTYFLMLSGILAVSREAKENNDLTQKRIIEDYEPHIFLWSGIVIAYVAGTFGVGLYHLGWASIIKFTGYTVGIGAVGSLAIFLLRKYVKSRYTPPSSVPDFSSVDGYNAFLKKARAANMEVNSRRQAAFCLIIGAGLAFLGALFALMRIETQ